MIEKCIADWHDYIIHKKPGGLEDLIADECVFLSPVVFTPQHGKDITLAYLRAAGGTLGGQATGDDRRTTQASSNTPRKCWPGTTPCSNLKPR